MTHRHVPGALRGRSPRPKKNRFEITWMRAEASCLS